MTDHELINNIHRRLDTQDKVLLEIRDKITAHVAESDTIRPALEELVSLWRGSKTLIPILAGAAAAIAWVMAFAKDHLK